VNIIVVFYELKFYPTIDLVFVLSFKQSPNVVVSDGKMVTMMRRQKVLVLNINFKLVSPH
jgi:hypothetical protein